VRLLFLSPHSDDAALSMGGWIWQTWLERGGLPGSALATVFSRSLYAPYAELHTEAEVSACRAREDMAFAERFGLRRLDLGFPDSSACGIPDERERQAPAAADPRRQPLVRSLSAVCVRFDVVCLPAGVGGHVDHQLLVESVTEAGLLSRTVLFEDLPYACHCPPEAFARIACRWLGDAVFGSALLLPAAIDAKHQGLLEYASQFVDAELSDTLAYATRFGLPARERWACSGQFDRRQLTSAGLVPDRTATPA
jgi:LmbE family N-acetylglucosaminyl deacetylase